MFSSFFIFSGTNEYIKAVYELSYLISRRLRVFPYHSDLIFHLSPSGYRYRKACKIAHNHTGKNLFNKHLFDLNSPPSGQSVHVWRFLSSTEEVIKKRKEALKGEKELESIQSKRNLDFLDILLCARVSLVTLRYWGSECNLWICPCWKTWAKVLLCVLVAGELILSGHTSTQLFTHCGCSVMYEQRQLWHERRVTVV